MLLLSIAANCVYLMCNLRSFIFCIAAAIHNYWKFGADIMLVICLYSVSYQHLLR